MMQRVRFHACTWALLAAIGCGSRSDDSPAHASATTEPPARTLRVAIGTQDTTINCATGGMQQRVALARVLVNRPRVLLMDEPFCALDAQTRLQMQQLLLGLWQELHMTVVFVTHDVDESVFLSDRVVMLTQRPARVKTEITVDLPRPRTPEILTTPEFTELKRQTLGLLLSEGRVAA